MSAYGRKVLNRGGFFLSSPVGHQAYLSPTLQLTHRVINKVAKETGFPCIPTINKRDGGGGGRWALIRRKTVCLSFHVFALNTNSVHTV